MATAPGRPPRPAGGKRPGATGEKQQKVVADNRRARFDYAIMDTYEGGLQLLGSEVKSLREGRANLQDSYATVDNGELWLLNAYIPEFKMANQFNHEPRRKRKILLHRREIDKLAGGVLRQGLTIVPLKIYFTPRGQAKIDLALAKGKKAHDKRETLKERSWQRDKSRLMRERG